MARTVAEVADDPQNPPNNAGEEEQFLDTAYLNTVTRYGVVNYCHSGQ